jgi:hypothetical protein
LADEIKVERVTVSREFLGHLEKEVYKFYGGQ